MLVPDGGRQTRSWIRQVMSGAFFLPGLIILGWILARIFSGLRLSVVFLLCAIAAIVLWATLSHFLPVMWGTGTEKIARKKD